MGFDTGSALSTANYKELNYWGITDLYWKQRFRGGNYAFLAGHMDPGDWADQYPMHPPGALSRLAKAPKVLKDVARKSD